MIKIIHYKNNYLKISYVHYNTKINILNKNENIKINYGEIREI